MGKKTGRFWGFLGALWLVTACLAGCMAYGDSRASGESGAVQVSDGTEDDRDQEKADEDGRKNGGSGEAEGAKGNGQDSESDSSDGKQSGVRTETETNIESGTELSEQSDAEPESVQNTDDAVEDGDAGTIEESGVYTSKDEVAMYLHMYGCLPDNYITKQEAEDLGWNSKEGNLWEVAPGMSIGGSRFGNYEGALPDKKGRKYFECDIDYEGGYRGAKRLIYSDDGLIFYTEDHYNTFEQLYGQ